METLFNDIQKRIADNIAWLNKQVDEDYGQLDMLYRDDGDSETYPMVFPMVLVDTPEVEWQTLGGAGRMERAKEVDALLQMYKPECCQTPLVRKRSRFHTMPRGIKVYETHYECTVWDNAVSR